jgi:hypothetical protein
LYSLPNITWVIKSRRVKWAEHVEHTVEIRNAYKILAGTKETPWNYVDGIYNRQLPVPALIIVSTCSAVTQEITRTPMKFI